jgi:hypothetical protein
MRNHWGWLVCLSLLSACHTPPRGSEEYWFNKLKDEQRAQCSQLPEPLSTTCLQDVENKSYEDFKKNNQLRDTSK